MTSSVHATALENKASDLIVSGPSGSGKTTLIKQLLKDYGDKIEFSVSHTTRTKRDGENQDVDYHFVNLDEFQKLIAEGRFLQYAEIHGNIYGTTKMAVKKVRDKGKIVIFDVLAESALKLRNQLDPRPLLIFIKPPSLEVLEQRLRGRTTGGEEDIQRRMKAAEKELKHETSFDHVILNDDLRTAYEELKKIAFPEMDKVSGRKM